MEALNNKLLLFNSTVLLNRREVLESFDDFVEHHRQKDNEEGYSEGKRKILLSLCDEFRKELMRVDIPTLKKPWLYYDYSINNDSLCLALFKCDNVEFDIDDEISSVTHSMEYTLVEVKCDYLTVEQYAEVYGVTTTTVRQWIRRGKLRTAKKVGRDWTIPALADKPKRGFDSVTYYWSDIDRNITDAFPFLDNTECVYIFQDDDEKTIFHAITGWDGTANRRKVELTTREREQLEILLIAAPGTKVEDVNTQIRNVPAKRNFTLPILHYQDSEAEKNSFTFDSIVVQQHHSATFMFSPNDNPQASSSYDHTSTYLIPISWDFWGVPFDYDDIRYETVLGGDYSDCLKIGDLFGYLILCKQMIADGYDPLIVCDDMSGDLEYVMSALIDDGGPLNEDTGETLLDILYIHELTIEDGLQCQGLGSRIMRELPFLCRELLHVMPDVLAYFPSTIENPIDVKNERLNDFYFRNGYQELGDSRLLYAYVEF